MVGSILPDTDVLVDYFKGHAKAIAFVNANAARIILSSIVVAELFAGIRGRAENDILKKFIAIFPIIPVCSDIAVAGGLYKRDYGKFVGFQGKAIINIQNLKRIAEQLFVIWCLRFQISASF